MKQYLINKKMRANILFFYTGILILLINSLSAQTYIGKNKLGKLEIINDSICNLSFLACGNIRYTSECLYSQNGDTIFISNKNNSPFGIEYSENEYPQAKHDPLLVKFYGFEKDEYILYYESCFYSMYDTTYTKMIINLPMSTKAGDLFVINDGVYYRRFKVGVDYSEKIKSVIVDIQNTKISELCFDKFPLLVKGRRLIPCGNKNQLEDCWINNGFYFPVMRKRKPESNFETLQIWSLGLQGLPYFKYLNNEK